jgi:hypothetical protein
MAGRTVTETPETLFALMRLAYRPPGYDSPMSAVSAVELEPGDQVPVDRLPSWIVATWRSQRHVSSTLPEDLEPAPAADSGMYMPAGNIDLDRTCWEANQGSRDSIRRVEQALAAVEGCSVDEGRFRVAAAIAGVDGGTTLRGALERAGCDVGAISQALPSIRSEEVAAATERERVQWRDAMRAA